LKCTIKTVTSIAIIIIIIVITAIEIEIEIVIKVGTGAVIIIGTGKIRTIIIGLIIAVIGRILSINNIRRNGEQSK
jgi:hypothetical protein